MSRKVVVVGGGLAGLAAAAYAARAGARVTVLERARAAGGRASTREQNGFAFNLGPHALENHGAAARGLRELGVEPGGGVPRLGGTYAVDGGRLHRLPVGLFDLLATSIFGLGAKLETLRFLARLPKVDARALDSVSLAGWLATAVERPAVRALLEANFRVSTYGDDPERASAGAAIDQLRLAIAGGVTYVDGGWRTLVDGLAEKARAAGARIATGAAAVAVLREGGPVSGVRLADGASLDADAVILAVPPAAAAALVEAGAGPAGAAADEAARGLRAFAGAAIPVRAACLDVGLARLPRPAAWFALGVDRSLYLSVHTAWARLAAREDGAVVHVAKYLGPERPDRDPAADERELEGLLDLLQPGWRAEVVERRFLPSIAVSNALVTAAGGGTRGRPAPAVAGAPGLFVAGDWVGAEGMLADAALASAREAAHGAVGQASLSVSAGPATMAA